MTRISLIVAAILVAIPGQSMFGHGRRCYQKCCYQQDSEKSSKSSHSTSKNSRYVCVCLKDELYSFPSGGGYQSLYMAERYDNGCYPPASNCVDPTLVYMTYDTEVDPQDCMTGCIPVPGKEKLGLEKPVDAKYKPSLTKDVKGIIQNLQAEYMAFDTDRGIIRAIVFTGNLPEHTHRNGVRCAYKKVAFGLEVDATTETTPAYTIPIRHVEHTFKGLYTVTVGATRYGIVVVEN